MGREGEGPSLYLFLFSILVLSLRAVKLTQNSPKEAQIMICLRKRLGYEELGARVYSYCLVPVVRAIINEFKINPRKVAPQRKIGRRWFPAHADSVFNGARLLSPGKACGGGRYS